MSQDLSNYLRGKSFQKVYITKYNPMSRYTNIGGVIFCISGKRKDKIRITYAVKFELDPDLDVHIEDLILSLLVDNDPQEIPEILFKSARFICLHNTQYPSQITGYSDKIKDQNYSSEIKHLLKPDSKYTAYKTEDLYDVNLGLVNILVICAGSTPEELYEMLNILENTPDLALKKLEVVVDLCETFNVSCLHKINTQRIKVRGSWIGEVSKLVSISTVSKIDIAAHRGYRNEEPVSIEDNYTLVEFRTNDTIFENIHKLCERNKRLVDNQRFITTKAIAQ